MQMLGVTLEEKEPMNLSLLQRPKKIKPGTKTMYVYHPALVTASATLEPGDVLKILDVFEGANANETTLKVMKTDDWEEHTRGSNVARCIKNWEKRGKRDKCDCEKELSEMSDEFKEVVHYVLLSDVGK